MYEFRRFKLVKFNDIVAQFGFSSFKQLLPITHEGGLSFVKLECYVYLNYLHLDINYSDNPF